MKTIWLTMFPWMLVVAVCYGQAETNVAPLADWRLVTSTDSMTDKQIRRAETRNEAGYCFSIYRVSSGQVYGHFSLLDENGEVLDSRLPMYRIDKLEPYDLNTGKSVSRLLAEQGIVLCESKPKWVTFLLFHGEGEPTGKLREIMEGQTVLFRYWRFGGGYRETSFDLTGARPVIASAIGVSAERPEDIKGES